MRDNRFGALPVADGVRFSVWAPSVSQLTLVLHDGRAAGEYEMSRDEKGVFAIEIEGASAGDRYRYRVNGSELRPDPATRFQPDGVHGASQVIDPFSFQ